MAQKYYAIRKGVKPGIYLTWDEAKAQVLNFKGAEYKSFKSKEEANAYLMNNETQKSLSTSSFNEKIQKQLDTLTENEVIAFVDGSFHANINGKAKYSYGVVLKTYDDETTLQNVFDDELGLTSRNVSGEIKGVVAAINWAIHHNKKHLIVYYDYEGIEKWATKAWQANKTLTQSYVRFFEEKSKQIKITFVHTPAHTGIIYNEKADQLAKDALNL